MTSYSTESGNHQHSSTQSNDPPLGWGWEGHVHFPENSPFWSKLFRNWPELRSGIAFSVVFVVGGILGGSLAALLLNNRQKSHDHTT